MTTKTFEIRDRGTCIQALAIQLEPSDDRDGYLLERAGYGSTPADQREYIILLRLYDGSGSHDPYSHGHGRTMGLAHLHILDHFDELENGAVIDVEFIQGETTAPKRSEADTVSA